MEGGTLKEMRKWSVIGSSSAVQLRGKRPEQQIKSRVCPFMGGKIGENW